jgi:hypothetical protein
MAVIANKLRQYFEQMHLQTLNSPGFSQIGNVFRHPEPKPVIDLKCLKKNH